MDELRECPAFCWEKVEGKEYHLYLQDPLNDGHFFVVMRRPHRWDLDSFVPANGAVQMEVAVAFMDHRAELDRLRAENKRLEREKAEWQRLYEKKRDSYDALVVAYNDLKATLKGGGR